MIEDDSYIAKIEALNAVMQVQELGVAIYASAIRRSTAQKQQSRTRDTEVRDQSLLVEGIIEGRTDCSRSRSKQGRRQARTYHIVVNFDIHHPLLCVIPDLPVIHIAGIMARLCKINPRIAVCGSHKLIEPDQVGDVVRAGQKFDLVQ